MIHSILFKWDPVLFYCNILNDSLGETKHVVVVGDPTV